MQPESPAALLRITLIDGTPGEAVAIANGRLRDMVDRAVASSNDDLWRFVVQIKGGPTLLPNDVARLQAEWACLPFSVASGAPAG